MAALKVLSVAVSSGRVGYVFLEGTQLLDWAVTTTVSNKATNLVAYVQELINTLQPDVVVTEKCNDDCRKGSHSKKLIASIAELASHNYVLDVQVSRRRVFQSKYEEAEYAAKRHPDLIGHLPKKKRRFFEFEPRNMIVFEALVLAEEVINGPPDKLAAAMG
ncbi:hypothetical protein [Roseovarius rhodophyticola]|uniref:Uncharacterized protein n=1 Tax=Roseovarius rhodophyticola TaxID=3080827 RepID=A0ABZ2TNU5_9RHOB|nr:hypothetical protein [Roseovarius sp. W115]MDV2930174.1 hypothetical protein [Roseovarius sp. W115]